jgi:hypothetical protein
MLTALKILIEFWDRSTKVTTIGLSFSNYIKIKIRGKQPLWSGQ